MSPPASPRLRPASWARWVWLLPGVVAALHALGHLAWYLGTPLGRVPVLDERENLALAEAIARGALPAEPFYRAPGYALWLALLRGIGVPSGSLFPSALLLGALLHALNALLVARAAAGLFPSTARRAALAAGLLFALNPVFVHYSTQALDAVPALTFFLAGLAAFATELGAAKTQRWRWAVASLAWGAATAVRPNYLLVWCTLPALAWWRTRKLFPPEPPTSPTPRLFADEPPRRPSRARRVATVTKLRAPLLAASCAGALVFAALASWQWRVSGVAGFLPWQGAYNLWAANAPGAHGRYYVQRIALSPAEAAQNPARAESARLYVQETGGDPRDIAAFNAHWRTRFLTRIKEHPLDWLAQLGRKIYALLNNWEQYNNKTFAFHRARSPWLRWNLLGWGVGFVFGVAGAARLLAENRRAAAALALIGAAATFSILLFFVSARFRLPLAALAIMLAGGALAQPLFWRTWSTARRAVFFAAVALAVAIAFSRFDHVADRGSFVQDHVLIARAAATLGDDAQAFHEAIAALKLQPRHRDAMRIAVASYFNLLLAGTAPHDEESEWRRASEVLLGSDRAPDGRDLRVVAALALWRERGSGRAIALVEWVKMSNWPAARAALAIAAESPGAQDPAAWPRETLELRDRIHRDVVSWLDAAAWPRAAWDQPIVQLAAAQFHLAPPAGVTLPSAPQAEATVARLVAPRN